MLEHNYNKISEFMCVLLGIIRCLVPLNDDKINDAYITRLIWSCIGNHSTGVVHYS